MEASMGTWLDENRACMQGFNPEFRSPEHYILDITYHIWEMRGVERIRDWYAGDCVVKTPHGVSTSADAAVQSTYTTLEEFPDRQLLADDIIIGLKDPGFYSSHRVRSTATHQGTGAFGPATGKAIGMLTIADCLCRDNRIAEEWLVRDQASMALQLGLDPVDLGRSMGLAKPEAYAVGNGAMVERWSDPAGLTVIGDQIKADTAIHALETVWKDHDWSALSCHRDRALRFEGPSGILTYGLERMQQVVEGIVGSIPDGTFAVHHLIVRQDEARPVRVAVRWSFAGTHSGSGRYGKANGFPLALLALSHFELRDGKIINEWMLMDELAIHAQLAAYGSKQ
jgi:predicted ester cyclase